MPLPTEKIGPYTLIRQLGRGAFGVVWLGERRGALATTLVALKLVLDDNPDLDAIAQESQLWAQVGGHPNVLPIIEADVYDGHVVIVSEFAPDGSLKDWMDENGGAAPSLGAAVAMTSGILAGLEHLHAKRIVHRDLKPANVLLQGQTPRLADFGLARVLRSDSSSAGIAGTPSYMAPETFDGKRSEQSDIWSAGVLFYQLISGRRPFPQKDVASLLGAIVSRPPEPLPSNVPTPVREIIAKALQKDPSRRFQSATEMRLALQRAAASIGPALAAVPLVVVDSQSGALSDRTAGAPMRAASVSQETTQRGVSVTAYDPVPSTSIRRASMETAATPSTRPVLWLVPLLLAATVGVAGYFALRTPPASSDGAATPSDPGTGPDTPSPLAATSLASDEQRVWDKIRFSTRPEDYRAYLRLYPDGAHAADARTQLAGLRTEPTPVESTTTTPTESASTATTTPDEASSTTEEPSRSSPSSSSSVPTSGAIEIGGTWEEVEGEWAGTRVSVDVSGGSVVGVSGDMVWQGRDAGSWSASDLRWIGPRALMFSTIFNGKRVDMKIEFYSSSDAKKYWSTGKGGYGSARLRKVS